MYVAGGVEDELQALPQLQAIVLHSSLFLGLQRTPC